MAAGPTDARDPWVIRVLEDTFDYSHPPLTGVLFVESRTEEMPER